MNVHPVVPMGLKIAWQLQRLLAWDLGAALPPAVTIFGILAVLFLANNRREVMAYAEPVAYRRWHHPAAAPMVAILVLAGPQLWAAAAAPGAVPEVWWLPRAHRDAQLLAVSNFVAGCSALQAISLGLIAMRIFRKKRYWRTDFGVAAWAAWTDVVIPKGRK